jgi:hypothetical protein
MFRYLEPRLDIEVECKILFGWSKRGITVVEDFDHYTVLYVKEFHAIVTTL